MHLTLYLSTGETLTPLIDRLREADMAIVTVRNEGMGCGSCTARVQRAVEACGAVEATVTRDPDMAEVDLASGQDAQSVIDAVERAGYRASLAADPSPEQRT